MWSSLRQACLMSCAPSALLITGWDFGSQWQRPSACLKREWRPSATSTLHWRTTHRYVSESGISLCFKNMKLNIIPSLPAAAAGRQQQLERTSHHSPVLPRPPVQKFSAAQPLRGLQVLRLPRLSDRDHPRLLPPKLQRTQVLLRPHGRRSGPVPEVWRPSALRVRLQRGADGRIRGEGQSASAAAGPGRGDQWWASVVRTPLSLQPSLLSFSSEVFQLFIHSMTSVQILW